MQTLLAAFILMCKTCLWLPLPVRSLTPDRFKGTCFSRQDALKRRYFVSSAGGLQVSTNYAELIWLDFFLENRETDMGPTNSMVRPPSYHLTPSPDHTLGNVIRRTMIYFAELESAHIIIIRHDVQSTSVWFSLKAHENYTNNVFRNYQPMVET